MNYVKPYHLDMLDLRGELEGLLESRVGRVVREEGETVVNCASEFSRPIALQLGGREFYERKATGLKQHSTTSKRARVASGLCHARTSNNRKAAGGFQ